MVLNQLFMIIMYLKLISSSSLVVPFSLIGLIYEFYYTSINNNFLWTLKVGSTLFYSIVFASLLITLGNLSFYIKLNTKLEPLKRKDNFILNSNKNENTSKILAQTLIITILLNMHLAFIILIVNMPANVHNILVSGYGICSSIITFIVLISFKTRITKLKPSKRCSTENLSLNRQRKVMFKHYDSSNTNSTSFNSEIQSIFS